MVENKWQTHNIIHLDSGVLTIPRPYFATFVMTKSGDPNLLMQFYPHSMKQEFMKRSYDRIHCSI